MGNATGRQRHAEVTNTGLPGAQRIGPGRGDGLRPQPAGEDEVEDRQVVRSQIPEDVDVGLHQAKVDPGGIDVQDVAEYTLGDDIADVLDSGCVAVGVVDHQDPVGVLSGQHHRSGGLRAVRERLLHHDVLARSQRGKGYRRMRASRCRNCHGIDVVASQQSLQRRLHLDRRPRTDHLASAVLVEVTDGDQVPVRRAAEVADKVRTPVTGSDDGYS